MECDYGAYGNPTPPSPCNDLCGFFGNFFFYHVNKQRKQDEKCHYLTCSVCLSTNKQMLYTFSEKHCMK